MTVVDPVIEQIEQAQFLVRIDRLDVAGIVVETNGGREAFDEPREGVAVGGDGVMVVAVDGVAESKVMVMM